MEKDKGHYRWECCCGTYVYDGYPIGRIELDELTDFQNEARSKSHRTEGKCRDFEADQV